MDIAGCDAQRLQLLLQREMPFGKHKGRVIADLPTCRPTTCNGLRARAFRAARSASCWP